LMTSIGALIVTNLPGLAFAQKPARGPQPVLEHVYFSLDKKLVFAEYLHSGGNRVWNVESGEELDNTRYSFINHRAAFLPDRKRVLSVTDMGTFSLWDISSGKLLKTLSGGVSDWGRPEAPTALDISDDGKLALAGYRSSQLELWDIESGKLI